MWLLASKTKNGSVIPNSRYASSDARGSESGESKLTVVPSLCSTNIGLTLKLACPWLEIAPRFLGVSSYFTIYNEKDKKEGITVFILILWHSVMCTHWNFLTVRVRLRDEIFWSYAITKTLLFRKKSTSKLLEAKLKPSNTTKYLKNTI